MNNTGISLSQLESHLWEAANILRGPVDAADFKTYVFPLLFFKHKDRRKQVLIVDASREFKTGRAQNELLPEHVERIHGWYRDYRDVEGVARVVTLDEIAANEHNLNIPRYVEPKTEQEVLSVEEAMSRLREAADAAFAAEGKLIAILKREGLLL